MITVDYFGKNGERGNPVWSKTWDKSPFDKGVSVDWKTGTVRTPLYEPPEIPAEEVKTPFAFPQWNVTEEPQENGDIHIIIDDGNVIWRYTDAEGIDHGEVFTCVGQDFGVKEKTGTIVWVLKELYSAGTVEFIEGEVAPQEDWKDWLAYVPLAVVIVDEDIGYVITQKHGDSIFMSDSGTPVDVLASEDKVVRIAGEDGASSQYRIVVDPITEDGKIKFYVGIVQLDENGEPLPPEPTPPTCGHPGNGGGGGDDHPDQPTEDHPGNEDDEDDHPGNGEGEDGVTPESGGEDCG